MYGWITIILQYFTIFKLPRSQEIFHIFPRSAQETLPRFSRARPPGSQVCIPQKCSELLRMGSTKLNSETGCCTQLSSKAWKVEAQDVPGTSYFALTLQQVEQLARSAIKSIKRERLLSQVFMLPHFYSNNENSKTSLNEIEKCELQLLFIMNVKTSQIMSCHSW